MQTDPFEIIRNSEAELPQDQDTHLTKELSAAYHTDELAAGDRAVERIAEKIRALLAGQDTVPK